MPEIFRRRNSNLTIRQALSRTRLELLPSEIREDKLAQWVMEFDDLRSRERYDRPDREDPEDYALWALDLVVVGGLQRQIPFYFATLFQIGRQWKVSESTLASIDSASSQKSLRATARLNRRRDEEILREGSVGEMYERSERDATEALTALLRSAREQQSSRLREARQWWTSWREEVSSIRNHVDRLQELGHRRPDPTLWGEVSRFLVRSYRPSMLRHTLEASGVRFAGDLAITPGFSLPGSYVEVLTPLLFLGLSLGGSRGPFIEHFFFEWRHILHDLRYEVENGESRRIGLETLVRKYAQSEDPFEQYLPLRTPASEVLRNLVIEHTLPGNQSSPWLSTWRRCVEFNPATAINVPVKNLQDRESVSAFARDADCAIKQSLPGELRPGETWGEFVQRLFEMEWVLKTASQLVLNEYNANVWRFEGFTVLVDVVASALNVVGYRIDPPSHSRLRSLWDRLHGENPWSVVEF